MTADGVLPPRPRKVTCRMLVERRGSLDRCGGQELFPGCGWCRHHLAEAAEIYRRITEGLIPPDEH